MEATMEFVFYSWIIFACIWVIFKIWDTCEHYGNGMIDFIFSMIALISLPLLAFGILMLAISPAVYVNTWVSLELMNYLNEDSVWAEWAVVIASCFTGVVGLLIGLALTTLYFMLLVVMSSKVSNWFAFRRMVRRDYARKEREREARMTQLENN